MGVGDVDRLPGCDCPIRDIPFRPSFGVAVNCGIRLLFIGLRALIILNQFLY